MNITFRTLSLSLYAYPFLLTRSPWVVSVVCAQHCPMACSQDNGSLQTAMLIYYTVSGFMLFFQYLHDISWPQLLSPLVKYRIWGKHREGRRNRHAPRFSIAFSGGGAFRRRGCGKQVALGAISDRNTCAGSTLSNNMMQLTRSISCCEFTIFHDVHLQRLQRF